MNGDEENRVALHLGESAGRLGIVGVGSLGLGGGTSIVEGIGDGQAHWWREREEGGFLEGDCGLGVEV